jgi:uroporphyrinogen decarboxylase
MATMSPKQQAIEALELRQPPGLVPCFELEFQLTEEAFGRSFPGHHQIQNATEKERDRLYHQIAELFILIAETYDWNVIMDTRSPGEEGYIRTVRTIRSLVGDKYLYIVHGDGTYAIPSGSNMVEHAAAFFDRPDDMKRNADRMVDGALERGRRLVDGGIDGFALCADYCFNDGPFLSPPMFREFVTPYLARLCAGYREMGAYVIKHTDGNIMPILDQLVEARPHGIHSLDPQGAVDIAEVKRRYGRDVCLVGNVNCGLMQTGTDEEVIESAAYALRHGMPGGGFIFSMSNVAFKGMPLERYDLIQKVRHEQGWYPE